MLGKLSQAQRDSKDSRAVALRVYCGIPIQSRKWAEKVENEFVLESGELREVTYSSVCVQWVSEGDWCKCGELPLATDSGGGFSTEKVKTFCSSCKQAWNDRVPS